MENLKICNYKLASPKKLNAVTFVQAITNLISDYRFSSIDTYVYQAAQCSWNIRRKSPSKLYVWGVTQDKTAIYAWNTYSLWDPEFVVYERNWYKVTRE